MDLKEMLKDVLPQGKFWTDAWSLIDGCFPVSPGCTRCWLAGMSRRNLPNMTRGLTNETGQFNGNFVFRHDRLDTPLRAKKPRVYAIWSDLFLEAVPDSCRDDAFRTMAKSPRHTFIIITKRPANAVRYFAGCKDRAVHMEPITNVHILVTMEDQQRADERAPHADNLASMGWRVGALCEPLLGSVDLTCCGEDQINLLSTITVHPDEDGLGAEQHHPPALSWIITGGESGHGARPAHPDWFRSLRDQAQAVGTPFVMKQWGEWHGAPYPQRGIVHLEIDGKVLEDGPSRTSYSMLRIRKKVAGRLLDGREWLEVPGV